MPGPRVNQVGPSAGGAGNRLVGLRAVIEAGILGPALNAMSKRWALVEKDDCHRIVPHLRGALELHRFHVRARSTEENLKIRQIPRCVSVRTCRTTAPECEQVRLNGERFSML